jgi:hypothetical protein
MYSVVIVGSAQNRYNGVLELATAKEAIQKACDNAAPFGDKFEYACTLSDLGIVTITDGADNCVAVVSKLP